MDPSAIKAAVRRFYDDVWNKRDKSAIPALLHSDFTFRGSLGQCKTGHSEFVDYVDFVHQALGAYQCDILDLVVEGNRCFSRMRFSGAHRGEFFAFKPTGKQVEWVGAALFTFNVKETAPKATEHLTTEGHWCKALENQATAGMKPKRVRALIQRGALR